jgi:hypothetical protein
MVSFVIVRSTDDVGRGNAPLGDAFIQESSLAGSEKTRSFDEFEFCPTTHRLDWKLLLFFVEVRLLSIDPADDSTAADPHHEETSLQTAPRTLIAMINRVTVDKGRSRPCGVVESIRPDIRQRKVSPPYASTSTAFEQILRRGTHLSVQCACLFGVNIDRPGRAVPPLK